MLVFWSLIIKYMRKMKNRTVLTFCFLAFFTLLTACGDGGSAGNGASGSQSGLSAVNPIATPSVTSQPATNSPNVDDSAESDLELEHRLYGLWHASPVVGSGFSARLFLEKEYNFVWFASQMDGTQRVRALSGYWEVSDGKLELRVTEEIHWEGGWLAPAYASWGTDEVIVDAITAVDMLKEPLLLVWDMSEITVDREVLDKRTVTLGGEIYWELYYPSDRNEIYDEYEALKTGSESPLSADLPDGEYGLDNPNDMISLGAPPSPEFTKPGTLCQFNGSTYPYSHYHWADYEEAGGGSCLMILVDTENPDGGANNALYLPGYGNPIIGRNSRNIYVEWTKPGRPEDTIELMFQEQSNLMVIFANALKGVRSASGADVVTMPVSAYKDDSLYDRYYIPLYAILDVIGGGVVSDVFNDGEVYIFSGGGTESYTGFWETSDRGEPRADAVIGEETHSIATDWKGLELRPDGTFTLSSRISQEGIWVLTEETGRYIFWGRMLIMLCETDSQWQGADYTALTQVRLDKSALSYVYSWYIEEWDEEYLNAGGLSLYALMAERGDAAPRPVKTR